MPSPCDGIAEEMRAVTMGVARREVDGVVGSRIPSLTNHNKAFVVEELSFLEYIFPDQQVSVSIDNIERKRWKGSRGDQ